MPQSPITPGGWIFTEPLALFVASVTEVAVIVTFAPEGTDAGAV
jgi:hypothetical protein